MQKEYWPGDCSYPDTHRIYEERLSIAGVHHYRDDAASFCRSREKSIYLQLDAANAYDKNAIKIMGRWKGFWGIKIKIIGYVDAVTAAKIAALNLQNEIFPRLLKTYVGHDDYVEILYQIVGPKDRYKEYNPPKVTPITTAKDLASSGDIEQAIIVLLADIDTEEAECKKNGYGVTGRSYKALADLYKKQKRYDDEYLVLERFVTQRRARGAIQDKLAERFMAARRKRDKETKN